MKGASRRSAFAAVTASQLVPAYIAGAIAFTVLGLVTRGAALVRSRRIKRKSTLQSATGIHHPRIVQKSQGFMGGSCNTREFVHGRTAVVLRGVKWAFLVLAFAVPLLLLGLSLQHVSAIVLVAAFIGQYTGLIAEGWFFFAQSNHPQNLYYQTIS